MFAYARPAFRRSKAGLLGAAAGTTFALSSALAKLFTTYLGDGIGAVLAEWSTYALVVIAVVGLGFQQASLKVGVLPPRWRRSTSPTSSPASSSASPSSARRSRTATGR